MPTVKELQARKRDVKKQDKKLQREIEHRADRLQAMREAQDAARKRHKAKRERLEELDRAIAEAREKKLWTERACIDDCTTWLGIKLVIITVGARTDWDGSVASADRTSHADDCGDKMSQAELYFGWVHHLPGFAPANPPGTGTHEGVCDDDFAALTKWEIGDSLPHFAWGIDLGGEVADHNRFMAGARHLGFEVVRPYDNEPWHINLTHNPTHRLKELHAI